VLCCAVCAVLCCIVLSHRLSALEAVIEDGHSLHTTQNPSINPRLLDHISLVYSKAASSLAHMSQTVQACGSSSSINSGISYSSRGGSSSSGPVTPPGAEGGTGKDTHAQVCPVSAVCGRAGEPQYCWQQAKRQLAAQMQEECEDHWAGVLNAAADSPIILPTLTGVSRTPTCASAAVSSRLAPAREKTCCADNVCVLATRHCMLNQLLAALPETFKAALVSSFSPTASCYQIRHIMFTWSLTNATIDALSDLEQAVTAAVCAHPRAPSSSSGGCAGVLHRLLGWVLPTLPMLTGRDLMVFWYNMLCRDLPRQLKQGWPSECLVCRQQRWQVGQGMRCDRHSPTPRGHVRSASFVTGASCWPRECCRLETYILLLLFCPVMHGGLLLTGIRSMLASPVTQVGLGCGCILETMHPSTHALSCTIAQWHSQGCFLAATKGTSVHLLSKCCLHAALCCAMCAPSCHWQAAFKYWLVLVIVLEVRWAVIGSYIMEPGSWFNQSASTRVRKSHPKHVPASAIGRPVGDPRVDARPASPAAAQPLLWLCGGQPDHVTKG
jgi:hypothetical protein